MAGHHLLWGWQGFIHLPAFICLPAFSYRGLFVLISEGYFVLFYRKSFVLPEVSSYRDEGVVRNDGVHHSCGAGTCKESFITWLNNGISYRRLECSSYYNGVFIIYYNGV